MKKILVTGSTGMLGRYVVDKLQANNNYQLILPTRDLADLNNPDQIKSFVTNSRPDIIIHMAAETDVDLCQIQPELAMLRNFMATNAITESSKKLGAKLIYISSSNVFGCEGKLSYCELDNPSPLNYYGLSKLRGEDVIRHALDDWAIIRAGWMIGGGPQGDHKFVGKVVAQLVNGNDKILSVNDRFGSVTPASKLADFIFWLIQNDKKGLYHYACPGLTSRYEIAKLICNYFGKNIEVFPVPSAKFPLAAPRPYSEGIDCLAIKLYSDAPALMQWSDELVEYLEVFH